MNHPRTILVLFILLVTACRAGGVKPADSAEPEVDTDTDADSDADTDADSDADTDPCPWDGAYEGVTLIVSSDRDWECTTAAEIADCQIEGVATCPMRGGTDLPVVGETVGETATGRISGSLGGMGSIDTTWQGSVDASGLTAGFQTDDGVYTGEITLTLAE